MDFLTPTLNLILEYQRGSVSLEYLSHFTKVFKRVGTLYLLDMFVNKFMYKYTVYTLSKALTSLQLYEWAIQCT